MEEMKNILCQYKALKMEINKEERRISAMEEEIQKMRPANKEVADTVNKGKKGKKPLGVCTIRGYDDNTRINRQRAKLRERKARQELRLAEIENMILDAEEYINRVPDSETRMMMRDFFVENKSWKEVAEGMGNEMIAESCRKRVWRYLDNNG